MTQINKQLYMSMPENITHAIKIKLMFIQDIKKYIDVHTNINTFHKTHVQDNKMTKIQKYKI